MKMNQINENEASVVETRIAVLIDAENIPCHYIDVILKEIARYGIPTIKRIYADWTSPCVVGWKNCLLENAVIPVQQYSYTQGKNSTDSAMIIDAMDILYGNNVDAFCIVSSDSDFTRLATRLREAGKRVYGIGEKKTPGAFITACDKFIFLEILSENRRKEFSAVKPTRKNEQKDTRQSENAKQTKLDFDDDVVDLLADSVEDLADEDGWAFLGDIGNMLLKKQPSFDTRNYGFTKLTHMFESLDGFEIDRRQTANPAVKHIYIRVK